MIYRPQERILNLANSLEDYTPEKIKNTPLEELLSFLHVLEEIVVDEIDSASVSRILSDEKIEAASHIIRDFYCQLIVKMEIEQAQNILTATKPWPWLRNYYFYNDYESLITQEQEMARFSSYERLAYIGGGALPISLILYQQLFGIRGVSIEKNPKLVEISRKVLEKLELSSHIHVIQGDETRLAEIEFEGFIVDAQAEPKRQVFTHLHASAPRETKIIYRTYSGLPSLLYPTICPEDLSCFEKVDQCLPTGKVKNIAIAVRKV
jgi:hypothetical protein